MCAWPPRRRSSNHGGQAGLGHLLIEVRLLETQAKNERQLEKEVDPGWGLRRDLVAEVASELDLASRRRGRGEVVLGLGRVCLSRACGPLG